MAIDIRTFSPLEFVVLGPILFALWRRGRTPGYLLCLTAFFLYVWAALEETILPLRVDAGYVDMMRQARSWNGFVNLVPFAFGSDVQSIQVYGNVLLGVPMGFGLPFVMSVRLRRVVVAGLILGGGSSCCSWSSA